MNKLEKITSKDENFSKWYTDIVLNSKLASYGAVKGMIIFRPYGYAIWELIQIFLDKEFKKIGVENVQFPLLIPQSLFYKEKEHIEGFAPELATVTKVGNKELEEPLYIRPTSEVLMANFFQKEVTSYKGLPILYNQWCNVVRWEKTTRPFLRTSEFLWQEGHTLHNNTKEAKDFTMKILDIYNKFAQEILLLPVISGMKTEKEKFAGAEETYTIESLMQDGQALQCGTSHYFSDNFSKVYDIKFQNKNSQLEYPYSTSWGVSTRLIGAIIMTHADNNGLVLPSKIAPVQIQIIQIKNTEKLEKISNSILEELTDYRVKIDNSDKSFGYKISEAEIKGIPVRIEVGERDLVNSEVVISTRDDQQKHKVPISKIKEFVSESLIKYDKRLFEKAYQHRLSKTFKADTIEDYIKILNSEQGLVIVPFCGRVECENDVKAKTSSNSRCIVKKYPNPSLICFNCKQEACLDVYFARAY